MKSLKALHVIGGGEFGGAERHILNLANAADPKEVMFLICCLFEAPFAQIAKRAGLEIEVLPMHHKFDFKVTPQLTALIKEKNIDLVHTHGVRGNLLGRLAARLAGGVPVITTVHSLLSRDYPGFLTRQVNLCLERMGWGMTAHFIAVSQSLRQELIKWGIPADKVTTVYNGLDFSEFQGKNNFFRQQMGYPPEVPLVGVIARLHPVKGHRLFLECAKIILGRKPKVRFLIVGSGPERPFLELLAKKFQIWDQVTFTGYRTDIPEILASLDVLVVPSLWEGFGLTAAEGMAANIPVVATNVGGLPEIVKTGETGLLVPANDPLALAEGVLWMLDHPEEAREMTRKGSELVHMEFTAEIMARRTLEVYRQVVKI